MKKLNFVFIFLIILFCSFSIAAASSSNVVSDLTIIFKKLSFWLLNIFMIKTEVECVTARDCCMGGGGYMGCNNNICDPCVPQVKGCYKCPPVTTTVITTSTTTTILPCPPENCNNLSELVKSKYGTACGNPNYNSIADINKDRVINLADLTTVNSYCGNEQWCQSMINDISDPCLITSIATTTIIPMPLPTTIPTTISTVTTTIPCLPEVCNNLLELVKSKFGTGCGNSNYNFIADINKDRVINLVDLTTVNSYCGNEQWCQMILDDNINPCLITTTITTTTTTSTTTTILSCPPEVCNNLSELVKSKYRTLCGDANYNPIADINKDKTINIVDLTTVNSHCGDEQWCQEMYRNTNLPCTTTSTTTTSTTTSTTMTTTTVTTTISYCESESCKNLIEIVNSKFNTACNNHDYTGIADINKDRKVDVIDLTSVYSNCNTLGWCQKMLNDIIDPCTLPTSVTTTIRQMPTTTVTSTTTTVPCSTESCNRLLELIGSKYGTVCGDSNYNPVADINKDKIVNVIDMTILTSNCGNEETCKAMLANDKYPCVACWDYSCEKGENCQNCPADCGCPSKNTCRPNHELASGKGCVPMSPTDLCIYDCSKSNRMFCALGCRFSCAIGLCNKPR